MITISTEETLLEQFIWQKKYKRWFHLLRWLETGEALNKSETGERQRSTPRQIEADLQEIRAYFGTSIGLKIEVDQWTMYLKKPLTYVTKKQQLLEQEPLLKMVDQLFHGENRSRREWENYLGVSPSDFYHQRKQFATILIRNRDLVKNLTNNSNSSSNNLKGLD